MGFFLIYSPAVECTRIEGFRAERPAMEGPLAMVDGNQTPLEVIMLTTIDTPAAELAQRADGDHRVCRQNMIRSASRVGVRVRVVETGN